MTTQIDNYSHYVLAQSKRETAYERYNYAGAALELAQIRERLAELNSQHEPLSSLENAPIKERDKLYSAAFYVVVGRMPDNSNKDQPFKGTPA